MFNWWNKTEQSCGCTVITSACLLWQLILIFFVYLSRLWWRCWGHWSTAGRGPWWWRWGFGCTSAAANCTFHLTWSYTQMSGCYPGCLSPWRHSPRPRQTPRTSPRLSLSGSQSPRQTGEVRRALEVHQEQVRNWVLAFTEFSQAIIIFITNKKTQIFDPCLLWSFFGGCLCPHIHSWMVWCWCCTSSRTPACWDCSHC